MKNILLTILMCLSVVACTPEIRYEDRFIEVPVIIEREPEPAAEIDEETIQLVENLPIYALTEESTREEVSRAYVQSVVILFNYIEQLEEAIEPFQEKEENVQ